MLKKLISSPGPGEARRPVEGGPGVRGRGRGWPRGRGLPASGPAAASFPGQASGGDPAARTFSLALCSRQPWHGNSYLAGQLDSGSLPRRRVHMPFAQNLLWATHLPGADLISSVSLPPQDTCELPAPPTLFLSQGPRTGETGSPLAQSEGRGLKGLESRVMV